MVLYIGITTKLYVCYLQNDLPFYIRVSSGHKPKPRVPLYPDTEGKGIL